MNEALSTSIVEAPTSNLLARSTDISARINKTTERIIDLSNRISKFADYLRGEEPPQPVTPSSQGDSPIDYSTTCPINGILSDIFHRQSNSFTNIDDLHYRITQLEDQLSRILTL